MDFSKSSEKQNNAMKLTRADKVFMALVWTALTVSITSAVIHKNDETEIDQTIRELLIQQGKYERLLDSTTVYIFNKYDEYLPDTYWENDVYQCIYEGAEDRECWK